MSNQKKAAAAPRLEHMPLTQLIGMAHKRNPKEHDLEALVGSFVRFGFVAFPTIDEKSQVMVAGHGRCEGLQLMKTSETIRVDKNGEVVTLDKADPKWKETTPFVPQNVTVRADGEWMVPVVRGVAFENDRQRDAYVIADNQHTIHGGWNLDRLGELVTELRLDGFDGMGFAAVELDNLLGQFEAPKDDDADDKPETPQEDGKFVKHDIQVETTYCCPKCGYEWSGKAK